MKIAICDDDMSVSQSISNFICNQLRSIVGESDVDIFNNPLNLIRAVFKDDEDYEVIILDINMGKVSGLELAAKIHERDSDMLIIFLSAYSVYVYEAIKYSPFRYVRKNRVNIELVEALGSASKIIEGRKERYYLCKMNSEMLRIKISQIIYYDMYERKVRFVMQNNKVILEKTTIKQVLDSIANKRFFQINSGIVVNLDYVESINRGLLMMTNGETLPISRQRYKIFEKKFIEYIGELI